MRLPVSFLIGWIWIFPMPGAAQEVPGQMVDIGGYQAHLHCKGEQGGNDGHTVFIDVGAGSWSLDALPVQSQLLEHEWHVCSWDRPGLGLSDASDQPPTSQQIVKDMKAVMQEANLRTPLVLVGHSFGGQNVRLFAATYPELVSAVILVDSGHEDQWQQFDPIIWQAVAGQAEFTAGLAQALRAGVEAPPPPVTAEESLPRQWQTAVNQVFNNPRHFEGVTEELLGIPESNVQLAASQDLGKTPLLVLTAGRSFYAYEGLIDTDVKMANVTWLALQRDLVQLSTRAQQIVVPNVDHRLLQLEPQVVAEHIDRFLRTELVD
ncbi:MAG: alpha/beta hydrolase [Pseudomonadales bacterium]|nr:alpha/beta hydrolase [Pseudomonadales bacterium]